MQQNSFFLLPANVYQCAVRTFDSRPACFAVCKKSERIQEHNVLKLKDTMV